MEKNELNHAIDNFLVKFEEMIRAANAINEIFSRNDMNWESTNTQKIES